MRVWARSRGGAGWRRCLLCLLAALFGMFSKENAILLPAAMLLFDLCLRRRFVWASYAVATSAARHHAGRPARTSSRNCRYPDFPFLDNPLSARIS